MTTHHEDLFVHGATVGSLFRFLVYARRLAIVEPVFAHLRSQKRLDRFTLRSKPKVNGQWLLYCLVHNITKWMTGVAAIKPATS